MRIYRTLFLLLLVVQSGLQATAQTHQAGITTSFTAYTDALIRKDYQTSLTFMPEAFFKLVDKEDFLAMLKETFENPNAQIEMEKPSIRAIAELRQHSGKFYSAISYETPLRMKFSRPDGKATTLDDLKALDTAFRAKFGAANVTLNEQTGWFRINAPKEAFAISGNGKTDWKFIVAEPGLEELIGGIIPEPIMKFFKTSFIKP